MSGMSDPTVDELSVNENSTEALELSAPDNDSESLTNTFNTESLEKLLSYTTKVVLHLHERYGVNSQYGTPEDVVRHARQSTFLLLNLGHIIRLYFREDYFDLILDKDDPFVKSELFQQLVVSVEKEQDNEGKCDTINSDFWK